MFASYTSSRIYFTLDAGQTWDIHDFTPATIDPRSLKFSPKEDNWILAHDPDNETVTFEMKVLCKHCIILIVITVDIREYNPGKLMDIGGKLCRPQFRLSVVNLISIVS